MVIKDSNRARFEGIGLDAVRRELAVGSVYYLHGEEQCGQAHEWVIEREAKLKKETNAARSRESWKFIATLLVSTIAAVAAIIAALPVIKEWLR